MSTFLSDSRFGVPEAVPGPPGTLAWLRGTVSRFCNGAVHARRRRLVVDELARMSPATVRDAVVSGSGPAAALASALGVGGVAEAVAVVAPAYLSGDGAPAVDDAVAALVAAFGGVADELCAARIAILVQACLPTAALIEASRSHGSVEAALRLDPPVPSTRRVALVATDGFAPGDTVVVELGGATAFGAGPRPCPGEAYARAMAEAALSSTRSTM